MVKRKKLQLPQGLASKVIKLIPPNKGDRDRAVIQSIEGCILGSKTKEECLKSIKEHINHWRIE